MGPVLFNSNDIEANVTGLTVVKLPVFVPPKKTTSVFPLANTNRAKVTQAFFSQKTLPITCVITRDSRRYLDAAFDSLWPLLAGLEQSLIFIESNLQRQYTATWTDFNLIESKGGYAKFDLIFTLSDQYGYDPTYTTLIDQSNITTQPQTLTMGDVGGSAEWQVPIFTVYVTAVTASRGFTISGTHRDDSCTYHLCLQNLSQWGLSGRPAQCFEPV
jgi:hypothetical protein